MEPSLIEGILGGLAVLGGQWLIKFWEHSTGREAKRQADQKALAHKVLGTVEEICAEIWKANKEDFDPNVEEPYASCEPLLRKFRLEYAGLTDVFARMHMDDINLVFEWILYGRVWGFPRWLTYPEPIRKAAHEVLGPILREELVPRGLAGIREHIEKSREAEHKYQLAMAAGQEVLLSEEKKRKAIERRVNSLPVKGEETE